MADTTKLKAAKRRGSALDKAMAALLAAAVGFVALAMPGKLFAGLFGTDDTIARAVAAALGGVATFLIVSALLAVLSKPRAKGVRKAAEEPNEPPRLRRADAHPDAPSRSPILAGRELGVPLDEMAIDERPTADLTEVENVDFEAEWERPLPGFIDEDSLPAEADPVDWEPIQEMLDPSAFSRPLPPVPEQPAPEELSVEPVAPEPAQAADPASPASDIPFWVPPGSTPAEPVADEPEAPVAFAEPDPPMAVPFRKPRRARPEPGAPIQEFVDRLPEERETSESTDVLFKRLEHGLDRRSDPGRRRDGADADLDQRLRSALGDLKKMSGRR